MLNTCGDGVVRVGKMVVLDYSEYVVKLFDTVQKKIRKPSKRSSRAMVIVRHPHEPLLSMKRKPPQSPQGCAAGFSFLAGSGLDLKGAVRPVDDKANADAMAIRTPRLEYGYCTPTNGFQCSRISKPRMGLASFLVPSLDFWW